MFGFKLQSNALSQKKAQERDACFDKCADLALRDSILSAFAESLQEQGFVGSPNIPQLVYLCLTTRVFRRPVSLVIKGPSGSGKSFALQAALRYVPDEAYECFSGMSDKALVWSDLDLRNKYFVVQEAAGLRDGEGRAFLRQLLSEGHVKYLTVQSTPEGLKKEIRTVDGPTGLLMTTTANALHNEDESRVLSVQMDESLDRIRAALLLQAGQVRRHEPDLSLWHCLHRCISSGKFHVAIPYAAHLAGGLPLSHFRIQRDFPHLLSLIQAHALLHQCSREHHGDTLVANLDDYKAVYDLISEPFSQGLERTVAPRIREVVEAVRALSNVEGGTVNQRQIVHRLGRDQSVISRNVQAAIDQGFLANENPGQGRSAELRLGERELPNDSVLPTPEALSEAVQHRNADLGADTRLAADQASEPLEMYEGLPI